jgi:hypothetical protein
MDPDLSQALKLMSARLQDPEISHLADGDSIGHQECWGLGIAGTQGVMVTAPDGQSPSYRY